jgi:uncharacterized protein (DUF4415 family)
MAKKLSASSQPAQLIRASAESIWNKPLTSQQKRVTGAIAKRQRLGDDSQVDYSDIPAFTDQQLAEFRRPVKKLVAVRLDADVLDWLKKYGAGYSTRINQLLRSVMVQER